MSFIEDLLKFKIVQPGDRVFAKPYGGGDDGTPHGWGTVVAVVEEDGNEHKLRVDYDSWKGEFSNGWGTLTRRITDWQPAKERIDP